jgi:hypothetical protein
MSVDGVTVSESGFRPPTLWYPTTGTNTSRVVTDTFGTVVAVLCRLLHARRQPHIVGGMIAVRESLLDCCSVTVGPLQPASLDQSRKCNRTQTL